MEFKRKGPPRGGPAGKSAARPSGDRKPYAGRKPAEGGGFGDRSAPPARAYGARKPGAGPKRDFEPRPARGEGRTYAPRKPYGEGEGSAPRKPYGESQGYAARKPYGEGRASAPRKPRFEGGGAEGYRSGPRARAAQEQRYADPGQRAERPGRAVVISLDPDLARRFPDSAAVNAALRAVLELAELVGGAPEGRTVQAPRPAPAPRAEARSESPTDDDARFGDDFDE
jgi:hypothetical protein